MNEAEILAIERLLRDRREVRGSAFSSGIRSRSVTLFHNLGTICHVSIGRGRRFFAMKAGRCDVDTGMLSGCRASYTITNAICVTTDRLAHVGTNSRSRPKRNPNRLESCCADGPHARRVLPLSGVICFGCNRLLVRPLA